MDKEKLEREVWEGIQKWTIVEIRDLMYVSELAKVVEKHREEDVRTFSGVRHYFNIYGNNSLEIDVDKLWKQIFEAGIPLGEYILQEVIVKYDHLIEKAIPKAISEAIAKNLDRIIAMKKPEFIKLAIEHLGSSNLDVFDKITALNKPEFVKLATEHIKLAIEHMWSDLGNSFDKITALNKPELIKLAIERMNYVGCLSHSFDKIAAMDNPEFIKWAIECMNSSDLVSSFDKITALNKPELIKRVMERLNSMQLFSISGKIIALNNPEVTQFFLQNLRQKIQVEHNFSDSLSHQLFSTALQMAVSLKPRTSPEEICKSLQTLPYFLDESLIHKIHAAVQTMPRFVLLSGPPGTGKTATAMLYIAAYLGILEPRTKAESLKELLQQIQDFPEFQARVCLVRIRPEWTNPKDVLGFRDMQGKFREGVLYRILKTAELNPGSMFFIILDEMNLSHPEHYLSDIISAMETGGEIAVDAPPGKIRYGRNIVLLCTINRDETVQNLSPRLLSRAFSIEMRADWALVDAKGIPIRQKILTLLAELDEELQKAGLGFGYRDFDQAVEFWENYAKKEPEEEALDIFLMNKLVTKIRGTQEQFDSERGNVLEKIIEVLKKHKLEKSETSQRIVQKNAELKKIGFVL